MRAMAITPTPLFRTKTRHQQVVEQRMGEPIEKALYRMYVTERLDQKVIGEQLGLEQATVSRWLRDFGITRLDRDPIPA
jgi:DNA-directed RNA polymerase specialized sigma subunit